MTNPKGRFGIHGGQYIPETLMNAVIELEEAYNYYKNDPEFNRELTELFNEYAGRPSRLYFAKKMTADLGGAKIYLKREDLNHTGAHKINNVLGQALLAKKMGKTRLIAETGAGQHGVASATAAALMGMECVVFMGEEDTIRQALNVYRMRLLGAQVIPVKTGTATLKDAVSEAMREWTSRISDTHYCLGSVMGPHPFPTIVRDFQAVISREIKAQLFEKEGRPLVLGVTHPYASVVSENIHAACEKTGCRYLRLIRPSVSVQEREADRGDLVVMDSVEEAVDWLSGTTGRILTTTGSKELSKFTKLPGYQERVYARVLSTPEVVRQCTELGFTGQHLICMQGPFSRELNLAMLRQIGASYLVTKESGRAGGFPEKLLAAQEAGARLVLIGRPPEQEGISIEEGVRFLMKYFSLGEPEFLQAGEKSLPARRASLVGIGMGTPETMTKEAEDAFREADCILGSGRMLDAFRGWGKPLCDAYDPGKMLAFVKETRMLRLREDMGDFRIPVSRLTKACPALYCAACQKLIVSLEQQNGEELERAARGEL